MKPSPAEYNSLKPLLSRRVQSVIATPTFFQLDLVVNRRKGVPSLRDYHRLAFDWADNHQRVRLTLEALASTASGAQVPPQIVRMFRSCLYERPHPSPVARLTLVIAASLRGLVEKAELSEAMARYTMAAPEWQRLSRFFYPHQLQGETAYPKEVEQFLKKAAEEPSAHIDKDNPKTDPWARFWRLLSDWDAGNQEKISLENLVHHMRRLRTDYQKHRASEEIVSRAVRTNNEACLHYVHANILRFTAKRHRKAAVIAAVGIGLAALGQHRQAAELRDRLMACFMEDDRYAPGERFTQQLCDLASTTEEGLDALIAVRRMLFPRKPGIQDREAAKGFARIVEKYWNQLGSQGRRRLRWYLAYRQINLDLLPASASRSPEFAVKPSFYRDRNSANTKTPASPMGYWLQAFIAIRRNDSSQAAELFEMGWQRSHNSLHADRDATYRAAVEILHALARQKASPTLVTLTNNFLRQFTIFHGMIEDESFCSNALQNLQHEHDRAITRSAELMWRQIRQMPVDENCTKLSEEALQASLGDVYRRATRIRPMKRTLLLEHAHSRVLVKADVNGFEAHALQAVRPILGDRVPTILHTDRHLLALEYFEGIPLADLSESDRKICLEKTAQALAILHIPAERLPPSSDPGTETFTPAYHPPLTVEEIAGELVLQGAGDLERCTARAEQLLHDLLKGPFPGEKGLALIHGDLHHRNILFCPQTASIQLIDWEDLRLGLPEEDLAFLCSNLPEDHYPWLLEPYCSRISQTEFSPEAFRHYLSRRQAQNSIRRLFWRIAERKDS